MRALRNLDLFVMALALPLFLAAGLPLAGYAVGAGAWVGQRVVKHFIERRAHASDDPRTVAGLMAGGMIARGWLVAGAIFGIGLADEDAGLAAAVLFLSLFTLWFTMSMAMRPFDEAERRAQRRTGAR